MLVSLVSNHQNDHYKPRRIEYLAIFTNFYNSAVSPVTRFRFLF